MKSPDEVKKEYDAANKAMEDLMTKGGGRWPLEKDNELYMRLATIKDTLEWVHSDLIETTPDGPGRQIELAGEKHVVMGPTFSTLYP
jgi:hypothetical protein